MGSDWRWASRSIYLILPSLDIATLTATCRSFTSRNYGLITDQAMLKFHQMIILLLDTHFKNCAFIDELYHKGIDFESLDCPPEDLLETIFDMTGIKKKEDRDYLKDEFGMLYEELVDSDLENAVPLYMKYYEKMERFMPQSKPNLN